MKETNKKTKKTHRLFKIRLPKDDYQKLILLTFIRILPWWRCTKKKLDIPSGTSEQNWKFPFDIPWILRFFMKISKYQNYI